MTFSFAPKNEGRAGYRFCELESALPENGFEVIGLLHPQAGESSGAILQRELGQDRHRLFSPILRDEQMIVVEG